MERRLAAVLIADVSGYGRLSQLDEEGTRARFLSDLNEILKPKIAAHRGRLIKTMGDGLLVEFSSVVDAVRCAVEIQRAKIESNTTVPEDRRLVYRMGVNLGDVIVEEEDIHGAGVNIADRLQALADPGGVAISGTAYDQVKNNISVGFGFLGEQPVKNIAEPVRVYRVLLDPASAGTTTGAVQTARRSWQWPALAAVFLLVAVIAGSAAWLRPWVERIEPASVERMALPLPDKPSIAVLPLANMSNDPNQDYFADGITDDLITELSKVAGLFVIARHTSFTYKGKKVTIAQVAEELGVRYVLEGSVQRAGERIRINAQLIDALNGGHVWADRFDGSLADVFALQDKVTRSAADALAVRLTAAAQVTDVQKETSVPGAYDALLRGWEYYRRATPQDYAKAIPYLEAAAKLDAKYYRAYAALALVYISAHDRWWHESLSLTYAEAREKAQQYLAKAASHPTSTAHQAAGKILRSTRQYDPALVEFRAAIALDPGDSWNYAFLAETLNSAGRPAEAVLNIQTAMRIDPHYPGDFLRILGMAQFGLEQFPDAAASLKRAAEMNPQDQAALAALVATCGFLGLRDEAASAMASYNRVAAELGRLPLTIWANGAASHGLLEVLPIDVSVPADRRRLIKGLQLASVPGFLSVDTLDKKNKLTAAELRSVIFGHELRGHDYGYRMAADRYASITADGIANFSGTWGHWRDTLVTIEEGRLCFKSQYDPHCFDAFRHPYGSRAKLNEYFLLSSRGVYMFSQVN